VPDWGTAHQTSGTGQCALTRTREGAGALVYTCESADATACARARVRPRLVPSRALPHTHALPRSLRSLTLMRNNLLYLLCLLTCVRVCVCIRVASGDDGPRAVRARGRQAALRVRRRGRRHQPRRALHVQGQGAHPV
jgi:hypothetical protein